MSGGTALKTAFLLSTAVLAVAGSATAQAWDAGGFEIDKLDTGCSMSTDFNIPGRSDIRWFLSLSEEGQAIGSITSLDWSNPGDGPQDITYMFRRSGAEPTVFSGGSYGLTESSIYHGFVTGFASEALDEFASADSLVVMKGVEASVEDDSAPEPVIVAHFNLRGSSLAVASLRRCAARVRSENDARRARENRFNYIERDPFKSN